jgi:hypothetical protein
MLICANLFHSADNGSFCNAIAKEIRVHAATATMRRREPPRVDLD